MRRVALSCAVIVICLVPSGALAANARTSALEARMDEQARELEQLLEEQREAVLEAGEAQQELLAAREKARDASRRLAEVERHGGVLSATQPTARVVSAYAEQAAADEEQAAAELERATARAARTQGAALDARRRIDAFRAAVEGARRAPPRADAIRYGFGGPQAAPVSAKTIDDYLQSKASPLAGQGRHFVTSGVRWRIDPRMLVAIAGAESVFGLKTCASHNAWGWGCPTRPYAFDSWAGGIDTVAKGLREGYLDDGLTTVGEIHLRYAPPAAANDPTGLNYAWADNVAHFLLEQGGNPQKLDGSGPNGRALTGTH